MTNKSWINEIIRMLNNNVPNCRAELEKYENPYDDIDNIKTVRVYFDNEDRNSITLYLSIATDGSPSRYIDKIIFDDGYQEAMSASVSTIAESDQIIQLLAILKPYLRK